MNPVGFARIGSTPWRFRHIGHALLVAFVCLFVVGPAVADRLDDIRARGHLTVGVKGDYHPFGMRDDTGKLVGYDVDVARGLADVIGMPVRLTPVTSANRLQKLARGEIDVVVATLGDNRSRRRLVTMIEPQYYGDGANVLMRADSGISSWEGLRGRTLCSVQGSIWNRLASERLLVQTISLNSTREAALALRNGHCVGWLYDEVNLLSALAGGGWDGFTVSLPTRFVAPWAIAIRKEEAGGGARPVVRRHGRELASRRVPPGSGKAVEFASLALFAARARDLAADRRGGIFGLPPRRRR